MTLASERRLALALALLALLAVAGVVGAWLWGSRSESRDPVAVEGDAATSFAAAPAGNVEAAEPTGAAADGGARQAVAYERALDPAEPDLPAGRLRGWVLLEDDVPLDDWPIRLEPHGLSDAEPADPVAATTDGDGRFDVQGLRPGVYRVADASRLVRGYGRGRFATGDAEHRVVFGAYRLTVRVVSSAGEPVPGVPVALESYPSTGGSPVRHSTRLSSDEGVVRWFPREPGLATVSASHGGGTLQARREGIAIAPGVSAREEQLVLVSAEASAALQVRVRCAETGAEIPFLARLTEPGSGVQVRTIQTEDMAPDGFVYGLPVGEFDVVLDQRYREPFSFYELPSKRHVERVVFSPFESTEVEFSVPCGGRLRLRITAPDGVAGAVPAGHATARLTAEGEANRVMVITERLAGGGTRVSEDIPIGGEVVSHTVMAQGFYLLELSAEGYRDQAVPVYVVAGDVTDVDVRLEQELR